MLCVIDSSNENTWVVVTNAFQRILDKSSPKPNKTLVDKGSEFYNRSVKKWLKSSDIEINSKHNEGKSFVTEMFSKTLRNKIYKYVTAISENAFIDQILYI